jgi:hypothetical protein
MCLGRSQSPDRTQDNETLVNTHSPKQMQPINSNKTHKTIKIPSIESNQSKENIFFKKCKTLIFYIEMIIYRMIIYRMLIIYVKLVGKTLTQIQVQCSEMHVTCGCTINVKD